LRVEEASLTGESVAIDKSTAPLQENDLSLGDRVNMAYKGTQVINGRGLGIVVATGMKTEIGKIASMLQEEKSMTPLQKRMADFSKKLSWLILFICLLLFIVGVLRGEKPLNMLLVSISLAVAAIPEALPALITIALARGAKRLVKKNALIRKLHAVETLGSVTFICSDKTGTLTQNKMKVVEMKAVPELENIHDKVSLLEAAMVLNHDVALEADGLKGDPTEVAMVEFVLEKYSGASGLANEFPRVEELPFDSDRKLMTTIHRMGNQYLVLSKGAVESIESILQHTNGDPGEQAKALARDGMRVLAFAYNIVEKIPEPLEYAEVEKDLKYLGLVGMIDPPREEAKQAIMECRTAGIHPVMITGDHKDTAAAIAGQIGILNEGQLVVEGKELKNFSDEELNEKIENIRVYARVSPEQKLRIVKALQDKTHFVAMTGDGVNDAPSLRKANIGIAMGITGTDVSKESADMILLDDNFATIVKAVKEGRRIYDNIRRFVKYIMTCNSAEIWTIFMAPLLGLPIPLLPVHILWINLVTDGLPGLALSAEKAEAHIMQRPPRKTDESLFAGGNGIHILWVGILMAAITLGVQAWAVRNGNDNWQTMVFTVLSLSQLGHVFAIRSDSQFIYQKGFFSNKPLFLAVAATFILQMAAIYLPVANDLLKTQPLSINDLLICIILSVVVFHAVEVEKLVKKRKH
ncbi:MAG: cation-translocating P-type ATPase, partial [Flavisolibacter sp.]